MSNITVTATDLCNRAADFGCDVLEQKSWYKITAGENRKAIYVAKSKRVITKVHFAGYVPAESNLIHQLSQEEAKELKLGAVRGEINLKELPTDVTDEDLIFAFEHNLEQLMSPDEGFKLGKKKEDEEVSEEEIEEVQLVAADEE